MQRGVVWAVERADRKEWGTLGLEFYAGGGAKEIIEFVGK